MLRTWTATGRRAPSLPGRGAVKVYYLGIWGSRRSLHRDWRGEQEGCVGASRVGAMRDWARGLGEI